MTERKGEKLNMSVSRATRVQGGAEVSSARPGRQRHDGDNECDTAKMIAATQQDLNRERPDA